MSDGALGMSDGSLDTLGTSDGALDALDALDGLVSGTSLMTLSRCGRDPTEYPPSEPAPAVPVATPAPPGVATSV
jgi:hypothetical protein